MERDVIFGPPHQRDVLVVQVMSLSVFAGVTQSVMDIAFFGVVLRRRLRT